MLARFRAWLWITGTALSQAVFNTGIAGFWWVITGRGVAPDPDEPLSARIGRAAVKGKLWGLLAEQAVDAIFGAGHCRRSRK